VRRRARAPRCARDRSAVGIGRHWQTGGAPSERAPEVGFEAGIGGIEQFAPGNDHDINAVSSGQVRLPENLSNQSFSSVSPHRVSQLAGSNDAEPDGAGGVGRHQYREITPLRSMREAEHLLKFTTTPDPAGLREAPGRSRRFVAAEACGCRSHEAPPQGENTGLAASQGEETVSFFRPLARLRLRTRRPFFVAIRTRKPCVRLRWRRFGWNVTLICRSPAANA
jgi:hypothetical protein